MLNPNWTNEGLPYTSSNHQITIIMPDGRPRSVLKSDTNKYEAILEAIRSGRWADIPRLMDLKKAIEQHSENKFEVRNDNVYINGDKIPETLSRKIISFTKEKIPVEPLIRFWENLNRNPSFRSVQQLYAFLDKNDHAITPDGCFIAYRAVRNDFKDIHSGTMDNSPGKTVSMKRNQVNEDPTQACSYGLHVANFQYAKNFNSENGHLLIVKVNPEHVVAVPDSYNAEKMRVCEFVVIEEIKEEPNETTLYDDGSALATPNAPPILSATEDAPPALENNDQAKLNGDYPEDDEDDYDDDEDDEEDDDYEDDEEDDEDDEDDDDDDDDDEDDEDEKFEDDDDDFSTEY